MSENTDHRKQSLYFPRQMLEEIRAEAKRLDRSLSWIMQQTWKISKPRLANFPGPGEVIPVLNNAS